MTERIPPNLGENGHDLTASLLSPFVSKTQIVLPPVAHVSHLPDGTSALTFRFVDDGRADICVLGPRTRATYKPGSPFRVVIRVVFRPGGSYPFFGIPLSEVTDRVVPLRDLWGTSADVLLDKLVNAPTHAQRVEEMNSALIDKLVGPRMFEPVAIPLVKDTLVQLGRAAQVHGVARTLQVSERNLRRVFSAVVGLSPKRYARIIRFRQAVARVKSSGVPRWCEIAAESGYFDQAHMCADFRELAQTSPTAFLRGDAPVGALFGCARG